MTVPAALSRNQIFLRVALCACVLSSFGLLVRGTPLLGAILLSPFALVRGILFGGICTIIWTIAISLRVAAVSEDRDPFWKAFGSTLTALIVGLAPHAVFLIAINLSPYTLSGGRIVSAMHWYETGVQMLQDVVGPYLMLTFAAGVLAAFAVFLIKVGMPGSTAGPRLAAVLSAMRTGGLVLIAATSFTVFSAAPAGGWRPNSTMALQAVWKDNVEQSSELAVVETLISELRKPGSTLRAGMSSILEKLPWIEPDDRRATGRRSFYETNSVLQPKPNDSFDSTSHEDRAEPPPREVVEAIASANREVELKVEAARELLSGIIGSIFGQTGGEFVRGFLSAFIEDAATRIASDTLMRSSATDGLATKVSEVQVKLEALKGQLVVATLPFILAIEQRLQRRDFMLGRSMQVRDAIVRERQAKQVEAFRERARPRGR